MEQTKSCHPMTPAAQLTTSLWLKLKQITQLPVIKHLGGSSPPWWPQGQRSQQVLDPSSLGPAFLPTSSRFSPEELRDIAGLKTTTTKQNKTPTRHKDQCRYSCPIVKALWMRLEDDRDWKRTFFKNLFKNCCGFAATIRIVSCFYGLGTELFTFFGGETGWCWSSQCLRLISA